MFVFKSQNFKHTRLEESVMPNPKVAYQTVKRLANISKLYYWFCQKQGLNAFFERNILLCLFTLKNNDIVRLFKHDIHKTSYYLNL